MSSAGVGTVGCSPKLGDSAETETQGVTAAWARGQMSGPSRLHSPASTSAPAGWQGTRERRGPGAVWNSPRVARAGTVLGSGGRWP